LKNERNYFARRNGKSTGAKFSPRGKHNGTFVVDGYRRLPLCKYGRFTQHADHDPVRDNRIVDLACQNKELLEEFRAYTRPTRTASAWANSPSAPNRLTHVIGNILQDEKIPASTSLWPSYSEHTGADWK